MDLEQKVRAVTRRHFTKAANLLESLITNYKSDPTKAEEVIACHSVVKSYYSELLKHDETIKQLIITAETFIEEALEKELNDAGKYLARWALLDQCFQSAMKLKTTSNNSGETSIKSRLPALEFKKFDGNIKNWLSFWGQFQKIDSNPEIDDVDKLQYLAQSMEPNSEVKNFVDSFPLLSKSYKICLEEIKSRYAREDLLIQLYVRQLLSLVLKKGEFFDLTSLYDDITSHLRSLEVLKVTTQTYSPFLLPIVESAIPTDMLKIWERQKPSDTKDELADLLQFLKKEVESTQRINMANNFNINNMSNPEPAASCLLSTNKQIRDNREKKLDLKCIFCDKNHASTECFKLHKMTLDERRECLKNKKACALCLKIGHHAKVCKSYIKCYICKKKHSPVLCSGLNSETSNTTETHNYTAHAGFSTTLLQTVAVYVTCGNKKFKTRALFDSGSQRSYVREDLMKKLQIKPTATEGLSHSLFGGHTVSFKQYNCYDLSIHSLDNGFKIDMTTLGQNNICHNVPRVNLNNKSLAELLKNNNINLTDANGSSEIGLLIGADYSGLLLTNSFLQLDKNLTAIKTSLGWTLQGKTQDAIINTNIVTSLFCVQSVPDFWNLEVLGINDPVETQSKRQQEEEVLKGFEESVRLNGDGRYEVQLPWKEGHDNLSSNRELAVRRLQSTTNKLVSCGKFIDYDNILHEWEKTGIIETVPTPSSSEEGKVHYMPHRAVSKETSLTTKLRPVFDASAKDKNGKSLNACLSKGMNFIDNIPDLLIGFRKGSIGISADIAKAFLQISVNEDERDYLRFFWWTDVQRREIKEYRHCRVVFGLTSSPFLLAATIQHHLKRIRGKHQNTANILATSFYVDNLITSRDSEEETINFMQEAKRIMQEAKFDLRQWVTSPLNINETGKDIISVLGLMWDTSKDELLCNLHVLPHPTLVGKINKRNLLSLTQRIFDPVGILCPVSLVPRLLLQETWNRKLNWDDELPTDIEKKFLEWYNNIHLLENCRIPRRLSAEPLQSCTASLHMFCDASKDGYAACVFLRTEDSQGNATVRLISAKSRISPPGKLTIPRLELLAALIGSRLIMGARNKLDSNQCQEFCWTDSGVALCWIKRELTWNTYVGNRVKEIRQNTNTNVWYHIPGSANWADLPSRGCTPLQLLETRWWEGPPWLSQSSDRWPQSDLVVDEKEAHRELKKSTCVNMCCTNGMTDDFSYFSKYSKIIRMTAWMFRFAFNSRNKDKPMKGELTFEEYEKAEKRVIKLIQDENDDLIKKHIKNLTYFYDEDKLLRIKTKLILTDFPENIKTPVVLPATNIIIRKLVEQRHRELLHAGTNMMITDLRKRFWIIGIRKLVKSVINKCIVCKRHRAKPTQVSTAPLPIERIQPKAAFEVIGVDLAGPIYLRGGEKSWIVVYTCAVYRAIHLELTQSVSTEAFIRTLRRFIARRGRPSLIISDNGTNFTGTKKLLSSLDWNEVQRQSTIMAIKWKLNAPTAAWWGGFFERMIKIIKNLLRRVLGMSCVSYEEMETLLCDCEAVVNDRPLTYVEGDDANTLEPLKPSCFLQALPQTQVTDLDVLDTKSLNRRLRYLQKLREDLRTRFKNEYLTELVQRGKEKCSSIKVGDVVLVECEEKRVKWPLGLVTDIYIGRDGVDRTAKVKTKSGYKTRPFQRLYQLELSSSEVEGRQESSSIPDPVGKKYSIVVNPSATSTKRDSAEPADTTPVGRENVVKATRFGRIIKMPSKFN